MEITTDVLLRGAVWKHVIDSLAPLFQTRAHYEIFVLATSIGIMYDRRIEKPDDDNEEPKNVPRNVLQNNSGDRLDLMFQAAILTTKTEDYSEDDRLEIAFGDKIPFNKIAFLTQFANFGATKLEEYIGTTAIESMDNIKNFLSSSVEGRNLEIDALPDDLLLQDD